MAKPLTPIGFLVTETGVIAFVSPSGKHTFEGAVTPAVAEHAGSSATQTLPEKLPPGGLTVRVLADEERPPEVRDPADGNAQLVQKATTFFGGWKPAKPPTPPAAPAAEGDYTGYLAPKKPRG